jgi:hypothetical protein
VLLDAIVMAGVPLGSFSKMGVWKMKRWFSYMRPLAWGTAYLAGLMILGLAMSGGWTIDSYAAGGTQDAARLDRLNARFMSERDQEKREDILIVLCRDFEEPAFETIFRTLSEDSGLVQSRAADLIGGYYLAAPVYADDAEHLGETRSDRITEGRTKVVTTLKNLTATDRITLKINCLRSLIRMGQVDSALVDELYHIALGDGKERWRYDCESCWGGKSKEVIDSHQQKDASGLLSRLKRLGFYREVIEGYQRDILERVKVQSENTPSPAYDIMKEWISKDLDGELENGGCHSSSSYEDQWWGSQSGMYAQDWCGDLRNSYDPQICSPFKDYSTIGGDCANFASQCLWSGGLIACTASWCDGCAGSGNCCIKKVVSRLLWKMPSVASGTSFST